MAFWPVISSKEKAIRCARFGFWAAMISTVVTLLFVLLSVSGTATIGGIDAYALFDVTLMFIFAIGIWFYSRLASILALSLYWLDQLVLMTAETSPNPVMVIFFSLMYMNGIRGTFAYHRFKAKEQATARKDIK